MQGLGLFARAAVRENGGLPDSVVGDAEQAYHRFEAAGDHWGMAMAARPSGSSWSRAGLPRPPSGWRAASSTWS